MRLVALLAGLLAMVNPVWAVGVAPAFGGERLAQNGSTADSREVVRMAYSLLIVDSSTTTRALLKHTIRQSDFGRGRIYEAGSGCEAIDALEHHRVDMILIDPRLADVDGMELIGRIVSEPETRGIPVVVMAARSSAALTEQLRRYGVRAQIRKPFSTDLFGEVAAQVLEPTHV